MKINRIIEEATGIADKYKLQLVEIDSTENINSMKLVIDNELFIQIYGNESNDKLNLALVFKRKRIYGYDSEGERYHCHPFNNPDDHLFTNEKKSIQESAKESMRYLEEKGIL
jgi:hypothetical protein